MFSPKALYPRRLSKTKKFGTTRVNWFSPNPLATPNNIAFLEEVFESDNVFAWKVEYLNKT
jgi:hypothetical protein